MSRKQLLIGTSLLFIIVGGMLGGYLYQSNFLSKSSDSVVPEDNEESSPSTTLNKYRDSAGFFFEYPENVKIEKKESKDTTTYASLSLSSSQVSGSISFDVSDTKFRSIDEWVKASGKESKAKGVKLGELSGKEIDTEEKIMTAALDKGILFSIEVTSENDKDFWQNVYTTFLSTFAFSTPEAPQTGSTNGSVTGETDIIFEGEEVIE